MRCRCFYVFLGNWLSKIEDWKGKIFSEMCLRFQSYFQQLQLAVVCLSMTLLSMRFQAHPHAFASAFSQWLLSHTFVSSSLSWFLLVICPHTPQVSSLCNLYHIYYCLIQPEHWVGWGWNDCLFFLAVSTHNTLHYNETVWKFHSTIIVT